MDVVTPDQLETCTPLGVEAYPDPEFLKAGVGRETRGPVHGLRHTPEGDTTGWYIWRGEYSDADHFFEPLHVRHLAERMPEVMLYLALPPGWRFLLAPGHKDAWYDEKLNI